MNQGLAVWEPLLFYIMVFAYILSAAGYGLWVLLKKEWVYRFAAGVALLGLAANTAAIIVRMLIAGRPPLTNAYEFILTFCWGIVAVYLFFEWYYTKRKPSSQRIRALGGLVLPIPSLLLMFIIMKMGPEERVAHAISPALKSQWLTFHVVTAMLSYGAFAVSFGIGLLYLIKARGERTEEQNEGSRLPALPVLDEMAYKVIGFAFPMLTLCILTGAIWANFAWGTYWSWDPKETWSLITWIIYAGYLHARLMYGWKGKRAAWLAVIGFVAVLFTFFGVNYFLPGLHTYAS